MKERWKYMGLLLSEYDGEIIGRLNDAGESGWELVTVYGGVVYMKQRVDVKA